MIYSLIYAAAAGMLLAATGWICKNRLEKTTEEAIGGDGVASSNCYNERLVLAVLAVIIIAAAFMQKMCGRGTEELYGIWLPFGACIISATFSDLKERIILNLVPAILFVSKIIFLIYVYIRVPEAMLTQLILALAGFFTLFLLFFAAAKISKGEVGMGDVKLVSAMGFSLGAVEGIEIVTISMVLTCIVSVVLLFFFKKDKKYGLPLVPFILGAYLLSLILQIIK